MASNQIASGSVVLSANADQMIVGFQKASKSTEQFAKKMRQDLKAAAHGGGESFKAGLGKDFAQELGRRTFLGGVVGGFAGGGLAGGVSEIIANSSTAMMELANQTGRWVREMDRGSFLSNELKTSIGRIRGESAMTIPQAEKELSGYRRMMEATRQEIEMLNDSTSKEGWQMWAGGGFATKMKELEADLRAAESAASEMGSTLAKLRLEARKTADEKLMPFFDQKRAKDHIAFLDELKRRTEFAGMTPDEIRMEEIRRATPAQHLPNLEMKFQEMKEAEARAAEKMRLDMEEAERLKNAGGGGWLAMAMGAAGIAGNIGRNMPAKPVSTLADAVEAGTKEAYSLSVKNQFSDEGIKQNRIHEQNGKKIDTLIDKVSEVGKDILSAFSKLGIV